MRRLIQNLRLSRKISGAFGALLLIAVCMGAAVCLNILNVETASQRQEAQAKMQLTASDIRFAMARQENSLRGFLLTHDKSYAEKVDKHGATLKKFEKQARDNAVDRPDVLAKLDALEKANTAWYENIAKPAMALAVNSADPNEAIDLIASEKADAFRDPAEGIVDALREDETKLFAESSEALAASNTQSVTVLGVGLTLLLAAAVGSGILLSRTIAAPIRSLNEAMARLSSGDHAVEIPHVDRRDEVGSMAQAVQVFKDGAVAQRRLEA
ncbi:CHASE3 domain-containing protein, partial [Aureimonas leprariae]